MMGQRRLRLAARRRLESTRNDAETPDDHPDSKSTSPDWLQRSAAWFESVAARMLEPVEIPAQIKGGLAIASPHRRLPELIAGSLLLASAAGFVVASLTGRMFPGVVLGAVVLATPSTVLMIRVRQRRRVFAEGLPDVLHLLAGATRSGFHCPERSACWRWRWMVLPRTSSHALQLRSPWGNRWSGRSQVSASG